MHESVLLYLMGLASVEILVTFESFLNHLSTSLLLMPGHILHMVKSAGVGGG